MAILDIYQQIVAYSDTARTNNPTKRHVDWHPEIVAMTVSNPLSESFEVLPGETVSPFSGTRSTAIDGTTAFAITYNSTKERYRITRTGGTAPAFRTDRGLALTGEEITVTINNNAVAVFTISGAGVFTGTQVGDTVFVPNASTGDSANILSELNSGFWTVLAVTSKTLTLRRRANEDFQGVAEVVTLTANAQIQAYSAAGVQIGDKLEITAGFSAVTQKTFEIAEVTPGWVEFTSGSSLPLETTIIPAAAGMTFYTKAKRYVRVETDQEAVVRFNGDSGNTNKVTPWVAGDATQVGWVEKIGLVHSLVIVNKSTTDTMNVMLITCE